jgi:hypothetical protein
MRLEALSLRPENSMDQFQGMNRFDSAKRMPVFIDHGSLMTMSAAVAHLMELPAKMHYESHCM